MNILLLTTHLNVGGISRYVINLAKFLAREGDTVFVASSGGQWLGELDINNVKHILIPIDTKSMLSVKVKKSFSIISQFLKNQKIDIIHANTRVTQYLAHLLHKREGLVYISTFHGCYRPHILRRILKCEGSRSIAVSNYVKKHLVKKIGVPEDKIEVIYNGIDTDEYTNRQASQYFEPEIRGFPIIGTVCRLTPEKNVHLLIKAMPLVLKSFPKACLVILGQGRQEEYLKKLVRKSALDTNVVFLKEVHPSKVLKILNIFVSLSQGEPFGLSVIEAQISGVPSVVLSSGALEEIVDDRINGLRIAEAGPQEVAEAIKLILKDDQLRNNIITRAKEKVRSCFSLENMGRATRALYKEVLNRA